MKSNSTIEAAIEAILFSKGDVITPKELVSIVKGHLGDITEEEIKEAIARLERNLNDSPDRGIEIAWVKGGVRLQTKPHLKDVVKRVRALEAPRLSRASIETLAIVAYKQPITKAEIEEIRGVDSSAPIRFLLEKGLIRIAGRKECPGRPLIYRTTGRFLELFGLKDLRELPKPKEA